MKGKLKWILILLISLAMTGITLLFLQKYLSEETQRRLQQAEPESLAIVVFARAVSEDEPLVAEALAVRDYPQHLVSDQWLTAADIGPLLGRRLKHDVSQGEPLTATMLIAHNFAGLSRQLPQHHYAVTLPSSDVARHNGLLAVGDSVDVVFYRQQPDGERAQQVFTDLTVFDLGSSSDGYDTSYSAALGITLLVPAESIRLFSHYQRDDYSLWVRASEMAARHSVWQPVAPPAQILSWSSE
ncbi:Flp pilus assembly protein CpaB [Idiomarina seosinensis]|uniref:Flp pilus assembly protein CpaB n=1 Tax=Idiomarina seosinensis TaxID=281739 RepID=UPI00384E0CE5